MCGLNIHSSRGTWGSRICGPCWAGPWALLRAISGRHSIQTSWISLSRSVDPQGRRCITKSFWRASRVLCLPRRKCPQRVPGRLGYLQPEKRFGVGLLKKKRSVSRHLEEDMLDGERRFLSWRAHGNLNHLVYRGFSQAFYREKLYETVLGFKGLEDFMQNFWEKWACSKGEKQ